MNKAYCAVCRKKVEYSIITKRIEEYKGTKVNIDENIPKCSLCNEEIFIPEIEDDNLKRLYKKYGEINNIISSEEIVDFRNKYSISQRELVAILDWGKMTINRYENGAIPDSSHNDILKLIIKNGDLFRQKVEEAYNASRITERTFNKVQKHLHEELKDIYINVIEDKLRHTEDIYNGFRSFDLDRLENLISYIADKVDNLYATSLNKYLWFIDLSSYKYNLRSITGLRYIRFSFGPIIEDFLYNDIIDKLDEKFYKEESEFYDGTGTVKKIVSKRNYDLSIFKDYEIEIINKVVEVFKNKSCKEISKISHEEDAWLENKDMDLISYEYAKKLKLKV